MTDAACRDTLKELADILQAQYDDPETRDLVEALKAGASALGAFVNIEKELGRMS